MKIITIYPGSFQPPTKAHLEVYKRLKQISGTDTFVVTTDRTPTQDAPLNFGDKEQLWVREGAPASHIVKVSDWKNPVEVFNRFPEDLTKVVFALNQRDFDLVANKKSHTKPTSPEEQSKEVWLARSGKPNYFQPYKGNESTMEPLDKHAYVMLIDDTKIEGKPVSTANIRSVLGSSKYDDNAKKKFFRFVFGWFDIGLYTLITSKFKDAHQVLPEPALAESIRPQIRQQIQDLVKEVLKEIIDEDYGSLNTSLMTTNGPSDSTTSSTTSTSTNPTQQASDLAKARTDLVKQKKDLEAKAKQNKQQRDNYDTTVKNYDEFQKKTDRDALGAVNKQLSQPKPTITTSA